MSETIHIIGFTGSLRHNSYNLAALRAAKELLPEGTDLEIVDLSPLPFYNEDFETSGIAQAITDFKKKLATAYAILISTPGSTKNQSGERDPEMHQTKKGNQWYFGMKCHTGVDAGSGYVHTVEVTAANVHDLDMASQLIREDDDMVYGDAGYLGIEKRQGILEDKHKSGIDYRINQRPGKILALKDGPGKYWFRYFERQKSSVRSKVEHPFHIIKDLLGYRKVAYRGLAKNHSRLYMLFLSANLWMCAKSGGWRTA